jgi:ribosome-binding factor A
MSTGGVKRSARVAERLREELSARLRDMRDPRLAGVLVSRVEMPDDLQSAKVFVRREMGVVDPGVQKEMLKGLQAASGRLRRDVAGALSLRYAPTLRFLYDEAPDAVDRIEELLREIHSESGPKRE